MPVFHLDGLTIETVRSESEDDAIEFTVTDGEVSTWRFAILWRSGDAWATGRLVIDPASESVPVRAVEWALSYSRKNR